MNIGYLSMDIRSPTGFLEGVYDGFCELGTCLSSSTLVVAPTGGTVEGRHQRLQQHAPSRGRRHALRLRPGRHGAAEL